MTSNVVLKCLAVCMWCIGVVNCCSCGPAHPQAAFCRADFAVKVTVKSDVSYEYIGDYQMFLDLDLPPMKEAKYEVVIHRIFKGSNEVLQLLSKGQYITKSLIEAAKGSVHLTTSVHTNAYESACGATLEKGQKYLLTGRIYNGKLKFNLCNWNSPWYRLSAEQKRGLSGSYDCNCTISTCFGDYCSHPVSDCKWNLAPGIQVDECSQKHQSCQKTDGKCSWKESSDYKGCKAEKIIP